MQKSFSFYQAPSSGSIATERLHRADAHVHQGPHGRHSRWHFQRRDFPMSPTPPRLLFEVASCDPKPANSSDIGWNMMLHIVFHSQKPTETTSKSSHVPKPAPCFTIIRNRTKRQNHTILQITRQPAKFPTLFRVYPLNSQPQNFHYCSELR